MSLPPYLRKNHLAGGTSVVRQQSPSGAAYEHEQAHLAEGGEVDPMMSQVWDELMQAIENKDKRLGMEALKALVLYINDNDQEQDQGEIS